jgi:CheY-like chemotaxis protein
MHKLPRSAKRILIVDDDPETREGLTLVLEAAGHVVRLARSGAEALKELRICRPDLILLDLVRPTLEGLTFRVQHLRDPALADIPVVVLAGRHEATDHASPRRGCPPLGHDDILDLVGEVLSLLEETVAA